ncbi:MAG: hypothetical protein RLZZ127_1821 [Planctomycetota bacterium]|jgi:hypothetical protein
MSDPDQDPERISVPFPSACGAFADVPATRLAMPATDLSLWDEPTGCLLLVVTAPCVAGIALLVLQGPGVAAIILLAVGLLALAAAVVRAEPARFLAWDQGRLTERCDAWFGPRIRSWPADHLRSVAWDSSGQVVIRFRDRSESRLRWGRSAATAREAALFIAEHARVPVEEVAGAAPREPD